MKTITLFFFGIIISMNSFSQVGFYNNNMSSSIGDFLMPENLTTPEHLAPNGTVFPVDFGIWAFNNGLSPNTAVTASVNVIYNGSSVYSQTSAPLNFNAVDSSFVDTQYFDLGTFSPLSWPIGTYSVTYTINNIGDQYLLDNTFNFEFKITEGYLGSYSKSRTDVNIKPIHTISTEPNQMDNYDSWEQCITYRTLPSSYLTYFKGLTFSCAPVDTSMVNEIVEIRAYLWNDVFTNISTPPTFTNMVLIDSMQHVFVNHSEDGQNIDVNFNNWGIMSFDNQRYLFCVHINCCNKISLGYDNDINYKATVKNYLQPISPIYMIGSGGWSLNGFGLDLIPAITLNFDFPEGVKATLNREETIPYPNPIANLLTVPIRKSVLGNVLVEVFDLAGKLVLSENKTIGNEPLKVNVASIQNGAYVFKLTFANGTQDQFKISVNR